MKSIDLKSRFKAQYVGKGGDIKDPILTTLWEALDAYQIDVQNKYLLTTYAQRSDQISDGFFEVVRRHLFGQMFPGPAYVVLQADLREVRSAEPLLLKQSDYFDIQNKEGVQLLFSRQSPTWLVPALANDVKVDVSGDDLLLGFSVLVDNLKNFDEGCLSVYAGDIDPLLLERLRCRLSQAKGFKPSISSSSSVFHPSYPGKYNAADQFFATPFENCFLQIPFEVLMNIPNLVDTSDFVWFAFQGLGNIASDLENKLSVNTFVAWNFAANEALAIQMDSSRFKFLTTDHKNLETIIVRVQDMGANPPIEYMDAASVLDPAYPFQYSTSANNSRDEIVIALSPCPTGMVKIHFNQYTIGDSCIDIAPGRNYGLFKGLESKIKSVHSITPTQRIDALNDKDRVWAYFRSLLASRNRWLTKDDLRAAVVSFPPFSTPNKIVAAEKIKFEEKVGRVRGFLTPFTEIIVPVADESLLKPPDQGYFERQIGLYIKSKTVNGNFVRVKLTSPD
jgi:hypothetical protein